MNKPYVPRQSSDTKDIASSHHIQGSVWGPDGRRWYVCLQLKGPASREGSYSIAPLDASLTPPPLDVRPLF